MAKTKVTRTVYVNDPRFTVPVRAVYNEKTGKPEGIIFPPGGYAIVPAMFHQYTTGGSVCGPSERNSL